MGPLISLTVALGYIYIGIGSFIFHASRTSLGQHIDVAGMYACVSPPVVYYFVNWLPWQRLVKGCHKRGVGFMFLLINTLISWIWYAYKWALKATIVLPSLVLALIAAVVVYFLLWPGYGQSRHSLDCYGWSTALSALFFCIGGFAVRSMDTGKNCPLSGDGIMQYHALFHVMISWSLLAAYLVLRAEIVHAFEEVSKPESNPQAKA